MSALGRTCPLLSTPCMVAALLRKDVCPALACLKRLLHCIQVQLKPLNSILTLLSRDDPGSGTLMRAPRDSIIRALALPPPDRCTVHTRRASGACASHTCVVGSSSRIPFLRPV